ncbi:MAG: DUF5320 domain-containing protein [Candidatus Syntrophopropionicum ammoniitolerans]
MLRARDGTGQWLLHEPRWPSAWFSQGFCRGGGSRGRWYRQRNALPHHRLGWSPYASLNAPVYAPPLGGEQELTFLREQAEYLENTLEQLKKRIKELESKD